jgi:hypothetical protein
VGRQVAAIVWSGLAEYEAKQDGGKIRKSTMISVDAEDAEEVDHCSM